MKLESYTQQFMQDHEGGAVSQAQIKARFPELVPVIAARVAESIGKRQGEVEFAKVIDQVNADDSLRLDTGKRNEFIQKARKDLFGSIAQGNEFYSAGVVQAMDKQINQQELKWQGQTAQYHEQVQRDALSKETVDALNSGDPKAALAAIDGNWGKSSSLNNMERNKVYVDTVIKHAAVSDDPSFLDKIPQKYLNADSKAELQKARIAITNQQWASFTRAKEFEAYQRSEADRNGKLGILSDIASGKSVDPAKYISSPALHEFAVTAMSTPTMTDAASISASNAFRQSVLSSGQVGSAGTRERLQEAVLSLRGTMNPKELAALMKDIPDLMAGNIAMNDPIVATAFKNHLATRLDDLSKSPSAQIQRLMGTGNLRGNAQSLFEGELMANSKAFFEKNKAWPMGYDLKQIVDAAVSTTSTYVDKKTSLEGLRVHAPDPVPAARLPAGTQSPPTASFALPKGVTKLP